MKKKAKGKKEAEVSEYELAVALDAYTDPNHPDYDPVFTERIKKAAPHWFNDPPLAAKKLN